MVNSGIFLSAEDEGPKYVIDWGIRLTVHTVTAWWMCSSKAPGESKHLVGLGICLSEKEGDLKHMVYSGICPAAEYKEVRYSWLVEGLRFLRKMKHTVDRSMRLIRALAYLKKMKIHMKYMFV